ncbi:MAG: hypothetical protein HZB51_13515 [Chloroflexi bacterium]|nr:hypothetical protein [Chloroflexota bacterium]
MGKRILLTILFLIAGLWLSMSAITFAETQPSIPSPNSSVAQSSSVVAKVFLPLVVGSGGATLGSGIWLSTAEVRALPMSGQAWTNLKSNADKTIGVPNLANQDDTTNILVLARALVYVRTGDTQYRDSVLTALHSIENGGTYNGRALALGRELAAYVIAADLIGYRSTAFIAKVRELRNTPTSDGPTSLVDCHEKRPNNWGTMCGASRIAVDLYIGDTVDLDRAATILQGYLGDRMAYAAFEYGDVASWVCNSSELRPINPVGCVKDGHDLSGAPVDDVRRGGSYSWPPNSTAYSWGGFSGAVAQAEMLSRAGYPAYDWENRAVWRGMTFLQNAMPSSESSPTEWMPWVVNHHYGTNFVTTSPIGMGRLVNWTDWTHLHP